MPDPQTTEPPPAGPNTKKIVPWLKKQWVQIRGNAKWDWTLRGLGLMTTVVAAFIAWVRSAPSWQLFITAIAAIGAVLIFRHCQQTVARWFGYPLLICAVFLPAYGICAHHLNSTNSKARTGTLNNSVLGNENINATKSSVVKITGNGNHNGSDNGNITGNGNNILTYNFTNFQGNGSLAFIDNKGPITINNYYITQVVTDSLRIVVTTTPTQPLSSGFEKFTNYWHYGIIFYAAGNYKIAFDHALFCLAVLDSARQKGEWWALHLDAKTESALLVLAADSLDETETDYQRAQGLAKRAYNLDQSDIAATALATTSANYAVKLVRENNFKDAITYNQEAIRIYQSKPDYLRGMVYSDSEKVISGWYLLQSHCYRQLGSNVESQTWAEDAIGEFPSDHTVRYGAGLFLFLHRTQAFQNLIFTWYDFEITNGQPTSMNFRTNRANAIKSNTNSLTFAFTAGTGGIVELTNNYIIPEVGRQFIPSGYLVIPVPAQTTNWILEFALEPTGVATNGSRVFMAYPTNSGISLITNSGIEWYPATADIKFGDRNAVCWGRRLPTIYRGPLYWLQPLNVELPVGTDYKITPITMRAEYADSVYTSISLFLTLCRSASNSVPKSPFVYYQTGKSIHVDPTNIYYLPNQN